MRTLLSNTPIANSNQKPPCPLPRAVRGADSPAPPKVGSSVQATAATTTPSAATSQTADRHGMAERRRASNAGSAAFPRSPAKL